MTLARQQHREYASILKESGVTVTTLPPLNGFPDSVFLQDPAIFWAEVPILCRFRLRTRQGEEDALLKDMQSMALVHEPVRRALSPATLEGGDVLVTEDGLFVGSAGRTNAEGIRQLRTFLGDVSLTRVGAKAFHLLSGCSYLGEKTVLVAPSIVDPRVFAGFKTIEVPDSEAYAANTLYLGEGRVLMPAGFPKTQSKLGQAGYVPVALDNSEFWRGDGGISCLSSPLYNAV